jgi:hypothetical protein
MRFMVVPVYACTYMAVRVVVVCWYIRIYILEGGGHNLESLFILIFFYNLKMTKVWVNGQRSDESYGLGKGGNNFFVLLLQTYSFFLFLSCNRPYTIQQDTLE